MSVGATVTTDLRFQPQWAIQSRILGAAQLWASGYFAHSFSDQGRRNVADELRAIADELDPGPGAANARLLTAREVAGILGVTPDWVRARAPGWPFARRIGRWWRFEAEGVRRWTETQTARPRRASGG